MAQSEAQTGGSAGAQAAEATILDKIISEGKMARDDSQEPYARTMLSQFAVQILDQGMLPVKDDRDQRVEVVATINKQVDKIDELLTKQLNAIMHHEKFQKLEASWRGLHDLVMNTETGTHLKLRLLNITQNELLKYLGKAVDKDQSQLFKKVYEEEYGTFGGSPYSLLIGDYYFGRHPEDSTLLRKISEVAAAAHAPFLGAASPRLFDMDNFTELGVPRDMSKIFESAELDGWRSFREGEDSRYVTLTMPRYALRLPYGKDTKPVENFNFEEDVDGRDHNKYLWGNSAYLLGQRITSAFAKYRWCAAIRGVEGGGKVESLNTHKFKTNEGDIAVKCPTEISITDRREKELNDLGFVAVLHAKGTDYAAFFGGQTVNKPKLYNKDLANANARLSSALPYLLAASRFAHYIKVIMRDKIGSFLTRENVEIYLNNWIADFVLVNDNAPQSVKAQFPLREARVDVTEVPGKPGSYRATVFLRPHFQLEELTASIRLVAELPPPAAA
jgi:type VI secretion system protein ImpC